MVRMNPLNPELQENGDEDHMSSSSHKRSRSSLDYKGDPTADKIIPQEKFSSGFDADNAAASSAGRNAHSKSQQSGLDENMFAGMSSDEIVRHLYENPELAKSLGIDPSLTNPNAGATKKSYRTELLQKQGFPFIQWAIVLFLLGFGLYRFYKFIKPPATTVKQKVKRKANKKIPAKSSDDLVLSKVVAEIEGAGDEHGGKEGGDKSSSKKAKKKQSKKVKAKQQQSASKSPPAKGGADEEIMDDSESESAPAPAPAPATKTKPKKTTPASTTAVPETKTAASRQEDDTAADGWQTVRSGSKPSGATNGVANQKAEPKIASVAPAPKSSTPAPKAAPVPEPAPAPKAPEPEPAPKAPEPEPELAPEPSVPEPKKATVPAVAPEPLGDSESKEEASVKPAETESAPVANAPAEPQQTKKKAKKKKKKASTEAGGSAPPAESSEPVRNGNVGSLDNDEALAFRLQEEENKLVVVEKPVQPLEEDVWAEVSTKKKKNKP